MLIGDIARAFAVVVGGGVKDLTDFLSDLKNYVNNMGATPVSCNDLKTLRDNDKLLPGSVYRITDYIATASDEGQPACSSLFSQIKVKTTGIPLDLLVVAVTESDLYPYCGLAKSANDSTHLFDDCDLSKWVAKYDIDNNKDKYAWAVDEGSGVIYYMKDEFNNEAPYDFIGIHYTQDEKEGWTFSNVREVDGELSVDVTVRNNVIKPSIYDGKLYLPYIVIFSDGDVFENEFGYNSNNIAINGYAVNTNIGNDCSDIKLSDADNCTIGNDCHNIDTRGNNLTIGHSCYNLYINRDVNEQLDVEELTHDKTLTIDTQKYSISNDVSDGPVMCRLHLTTGEDVYIPGEGELTENLINQYTSKSLIQSAYLSSLVTSIGGYTFNNCTSLTSIVLPEGLTTIGTSAFQDCTSLTSIVLPEGLITIGTSAFRSCTSLTSITIPEGVITIGDSAFAFCYSLTSITALPVNPPTVPIGLGYLESIEVIYVPTESVNVYKSASGWSTYATIIQALS